jgi:hypothetical protein
LLQESGRDFYARKKFYFSLSNANILDFATMNDNAVGQDVTHTTSYKPVKLMLRLFPELMGLPKQLDHWLTLMG